MIAKLFEVKDTVGRGKGLFAKEFIPRGTIVCFECIKCKVLSEPEVGYDKMSEKDREQLLDYAYRRKDGTFLAPCDETRYLNHSCNANILSAELGFDIVVRDIKKGEEATYDYRGFYDDMKMPCSCGEENCCKIVNCIHPVPEKLQQFWLEKINSALKLINNVEQPLKEELKQISVFLPIEQASGGTH